MGTAQRPGPEYCSTIHGSQRGELPAPGGASTLRGSWGWHRDQPVRLPGQLQGGKRGHGCQAMPTALSVPHNPVLNLQAEWTAGKPGRAGTVLAQCASTCDWVTVALRQPASPQHQAPHSCDPCTELHCMQVGTLEACSKAEARTCAVCEPVAYTFTLALSAGLVPVVDLALCLRAELYLGRWLPRWAHNSLASRLAASAPPHVRAWKDELQPETRQSAQRARSPRQGSS